MTNDISRLSQMEYSSCIYPSVLQEVSLPASQIAQTSGAFQPVDHSADKLAQALVQKDYIDSHANATESAKNIALLEFSSEIEERINQFLDKPRCLSFKDDFERNYGVEYTLRDLLSYIRSVTTTRNPLIEIAGTTVMHLLGKNYILDVLGLNSTSSEILTEFVYDIERKPNDNDIRFHLPGLSWEDLEKINEHLIAYFARKINSNHFDISMPFACQLIKKKAFNKLFHFPKKEDYVSLEHKHTLHYVTASLKDDCNTEIGFFSEISRKYLFYYDALRINLTPFINFEHTHLKPVCDLDSPILPLIHRLLGVVDSEDIRSINHLGWPIYIFHLCKGRICKKVDFEATLTKHFIETALNFDGPQNLKTLLGKVYGTHHTSMVNKRNEPSQNTRQSISSIYYLNTVFILRKYLDDTELCERISKELLSVVETENSSAGMDILGKLIKSNHLSLEVIGALLQLIVQVHYMSNHSERVFIRDHCHSPTFQVYFEDFDHQSALLLPFDPLGALRCLTLNCCNLSTSDLHLFSDLYHSMRSQKVNADEHHNRIEYYLNVLNIDVTALFQDALNLLQVVPCNLKPILYDFLLSIMRVSMNPSTVVFVARNLPIILRKLDTYEQRKEIASKVIHLINSRYISKDYEYALETYESNESPFLKEWCMIVAQSFDTALHSYALSLFKLFNHTSLISFVQTLGVHGKITGIRAIEHALSVPTIAKDEIIHSLTWSMESIFPQIKINMPHAIYFEKIFEKIAHNSKEWLKDVTSIPLLYSLSLKVIKFISVAESNRFMSLILDYASLAINAYSLLPSRTENDLKTVFITLEEIPNNKNRMNDFDLFLIDKFISVKNLQIFEEMIMRFDSLLQKVNTAQKANKMPHTQIVVLFEKILNESNRHKSTKISYHLTQIIDLMIKRYYHKLNFLPLFDYISQNKNLIVCHHMLQSIVVAVQENKKIPLKKDELPFIKTSFQCCLKNYIQTNCHAPNDQLFVSEAVEMLLSKEIIAQLRFEWIKLFTQAVFNNQTDTPLQCIHISILSMINTKYEKESIECYFDALLSRSNQFETFELTFNTIINFFNTILVSLYGEVKPALFSFSVKKSGKREVADGVQPDFLKQNVNTAVKPNLIYNSLELTTVKKGDIPAKKYQTAHDKYATYAFTLVNKILGLASVHAKHRVEYLKLCKQIIRHLIIYHTKECISHKNATTISNFFSSSLSYFNQTDFVSHKYMSIDLIELLSDYRIFLNRPELVLELVAINANVGQEFAKLSFYLPRIKLVINKLMHYRTHATLIHILDILKEHGPNLCILDYGYVFHLLSKIILIAEKDPFKDLFGHSIFEHLFKVIFNNGTLLGKSICEPSYLLSSHAFELLFQSFTISIRNTLSTKAPSDLKKDMSLMVNMIIRGHQNSIYNFDLLILSAHIKSLSLYLSIYADLISPEQMGEIEMYKNMVKSFFANNDFAKDPAKHAIILKLVQL